MDVFFERKFLFVNVFIDFYYSGEMNSILEGGANFVQSDRNAEKRKQTEHVTRQKRMCTLTIIIKGTFLCWRRELKVYNGKWVTVSMQK